MGLSNGQIGRKALMNAPIREGHGECSDSARSFWVFCARKRVFHLALRNVRRKN
jgi:hypothetical protein